MVHPSFPSTHIIVYLESSSTVAPSNSLFPVNHYVDASTAIGANQTTLKCEPLVAHIGNEVYGTRLKNVAKGPGR